MTEESRGSGQAPNVAVTEIEKEIGLAPGFLNALFHEDDWSFTIKLHALVESVIVYAIVDGLHTPAFAETFSRLPLGGRAGKRSFARALKMLTPEQDQFIEHLSRMRNRMAHDPRDAGVTFEQYLRSLKASERQSFGTAIVRVLAAGKEPTGKIDIDGVPMTPTEVVLSSLKVPLWFAGVMLITGLYVKRLNRENLRLAIVGLTDAAAALSKLNASSADEPDRCLT
jgi:hypothetical protein